MTGASSESNDRGISTVVDVTFALLLVSASIGVLAVYHADTDQAVDTAEADQMAETLSAATVSTEYSLHGIEESDVSSSKPRTTRQAHGTAASLLGSAAVTNVALDGTRITKEGEPFTRSLRGEIRDLFTGAGTEAHVVAVWEPFDRSGMRGRAEAGPTPPPGTDVSTATLTVDSGIPSIPDGKLESAYETAPAGDKFGPASRLIAAAIVEGYFPPQETQLALEQQGFERVVVVNRYKRMQEAVDAWYPSSDSVVYGYNPGDPTTSTYLDRNYADQRGANEALVAGLADSIEEDLVDTYGSTPSVSAEAFADDVSTGEVTITVQTWDT